MGNSWNSNKKDYNKNWNPGYYSDFRRPESRRSRKSSKKSKPRYYYQTMSDLDTEKSLPIYLHYQSPNSIEEDLFTRDSRTPCLIHLHQKARQDLNYILRGSEAFTKPARPKSLDPRLLMEDCFVDDSDPYRARSSRNSSFFSSSNHLTPNSKTEQESHSIPQEKMRIDGSGSKIDIITIDTSGEKFERQANLRRSHRLSSCSVRQRANQRRQLRSRHKTLTGLPGNISAEFDDHGTPRYSLLSEAINSTGTGAGSSFVDDSSDEPRSMINGHVVISPRQNQKNAEIQTDDVKVIPLTPAQKRFRLKGGSRSNDVSPTASHASTELFETPTVVPCPTVPSTNQTSTPKNKDKKMIRPTSLDVHDDDTSTDEGRHTGESNPPTPVHSGKRKELSSPHSNKSSPATSQCQQNGISEKDHGIEMRVNGARLQQGEDRTSSGVWSGTESTRHSSTSDLMTQHAHVTQALQQIVKKDRLSPASSPILPKAKGQISPLVDNRILITSSSASLSTMSVNSRLSTLDRSKSNSSMDDRYPSANSSVVSVTITRSNDSRSSLNSEGGTAISAAAMLRKSRKSRFNSSAGAYNFMNYELDPLDNETDEISRVVKNRRSTRGSKQKGSRRTTPEDSVSVNSMDQDGTSVHSGQTNDSVSLSESTFSVDQEGYYTSMHEDCGILKTNIVSPSTNSISSMAESLPPDFPPPDIPDSAKTLKPESPASGKDPSPSKDHVFFPEKAENSEEKGNQYNSYQRAVKSNHSTPKTLIVPKVKSASMKLPKSPDSPALDFQSELNKRLSLRRVTPTSGSRKSLKEKRGAPPPPPKRCSSLSNSACSSPALSHKSYSGPSNPTSPTPSLVSPLVKSPKRIEEVTSAKVESPEVEKAYMETLPPPPTPDQLEEMEQAGKSPTSPTSPSDDKSNRPPKPAKPTRTSSMARKQPPATKPKPTIQVNQTHGPVTHSPTKSPLGKSPEHPKTLFMADGGISKLEIESKLKQLKSTKKRDEKVTEMSTPAPKTNTVVDADVTTIKVAHDVTPVAKIDDVTPAQKLHADSNSIQRTDDVKPSPNTNDVTSSPKKDDVTVPQMNDDVIKTQTVKVTEKKTPPAVKPKFTTVKAPVGKSSSTGVATKSVTSPKSNDDSTAENRRSREKSPSYRASLARAAFFGQGVKPAAAGDDATPKSTQGEIETPKSALVDDAAPELPVNDVPNVPQTDSTKEEIKTEKKAAETAQVTEKQAGTEQKPTEKTEYEKEAKNEETQKGEETRKEAEQEPEKKETETTGTPDSVDWLDKIEEFSSPNRAPKNDVTSSNSSATDRLMMTSSSSKSESAASRLLSSNKVTAKPSPKFSTYDLMAAIHKSKRDTLSMSSPPTSPGTSNDVFTYRNSTSSNGNHSPVSTLERKRNGRLSSNGHRNAISRKSTGATSRDDFKALLLQNACRNSSGSQMTATEKLQLNKPQNNSASNRLRPHSVHDPGSLSNGTTENDETPPDTPRPMLSLSDIRSAITATSRQGRPARRGNKSSDLPVNKKSATLSLHGKKHPPQSLSSKYNTRSRTPTRPMMSISEDSETEKSPEQIREQSRIVER